MIDQRLVLSELESLRTFELDRTEIEAALLRLRGRFGSLAAYEAFTHRIEMTDDEIGQVLARQVRYGRYIDSKVKLAGGVRQADVDLGCKALLGKELQACAGKLQLERYRKITEEVLAELKKRVDWRVLDSLEGA